MTVESSILSWAAILPLLGTAIIAALPRRLAGRPWFGARAVALVAAIGTLFLVARAAGGFDYADLGGGGQLVGGMFGMGVGVGVDGVSMPVALLVAGLGVLACWGSQTVKCGGKGYYGGMLLALGAGLVAIICVNMFVFLVMLAVVAGAMGYLVGGWGGDRRGRAARRFLVFAFAGVALIGAGLAVRFGWGMFGAAADWTVATRGPEGGAGGVGFWLVMGGCGILLGAVPLHWWVAEAVGEGATPVALMMVGVVHTLGGYGMVRMAGWWGNETGSGSGAGFEGAALALGIFGAVGMMYGACGAWGQRDLKRMGAFLGVGLSGFVVAGVAVGLGGGVAAGWEGAGHLLVCRGVAVGMMVVVAGMVEARAGHCEVGRLGGLGGYLPGLAAWSAVAFLGAAGMPGSGTFVGAALVVLGAFERGVAWLGVVGVAGLVGMMGCAAWAYCRVFLGSPRPEHANVARLSVSEKWMLLLMGLAVVGMGVLDF